jgi:hypothetical protein
MHYSFLLISSTLVVLAEVLVIPAWGVQSLVKEVAKEKKEDASKKPE